MSQDKQLENVNNECDSVSNSCLVYKMWISISKHEVTNLVQVSLSCTSSRHWVRHPPGTTWQDSTDILASAAAGRQTRLLPKYLSSKAENDQRHRRQGTTGPEDGEQYLPSGNTFGEGLKVGRL